jgi:Flp pilus assembly protein TadD
MENNLIDELMDKAEEFARDGQWQLAYDTLIQVTTLEPANTGALTGVGTSLIQLQRLPEAITIFQQVLRLSSLSPDAHNNLGVAFALSGQLNKAESEYLEAIEIDTGHMAAWKNLAQIYIQQKDRIGEGIQILAGVIKSNPQDTEALLLLAVCYEAGGEFESARVLANTVIQLAPENEDAKLLISRLEQKEKEGVVRPEHAKSLAALKNLTKKPSN